MSPANLLKGYTQVSTHWAPLVLQLANYRLKAQNTRRALISSPTTAIALLFVVKNDPSGVLK